MSASKRIRVAAISLAAFVAGLPTAFDVAPVAALGPAWQIPSMPPACTNAQANSGNVAGCVIIASGPPESRGWPYPPFPGESGGAYPGIGWRFVGDNYSGSPALAAWESRFVTNARQIGFVPPGRMISQPEALPLFEGFLAEIQALGYRIVHASGAYSFRCLSYTRKDCRGLTRAELSNHAYGLAADINHKANPLITYKTRYGASACATPMKTDLPQWVVQVAEKWGLYWGGYGWGAGACTSPGDYKSTVLRDPMHFEFTGTLEQARAIQCHNLGYTPKFTVVDSTGSSSPRCFAPEVVPAAGNRMLIDTDAPVGAAAALLNLTGANAPGQGYFTAESCSAVGSELREWSNGNMQPGRAVAGMAIVPLDAQGRFCLYQSVAMHSIVDVLGFFAPSAMAVDGTLYTPVTPNRTLDTRQWPFCTPAGSCSALGPVQPDVEVANDAVTPVDAVATVANITVVQPSTSGFLTADDCAAIVPGFQPHSNVNFAAGDVVANLTLSPSVTAAGETRFCTYSQSMTHELIDVQGVFAPVIEGGLGYNSLAPSRLVDTRQCWPNPVALPGKCGELNAAGAVVHLQAPVGAEAVVINITTTSAVQYASYVSVGPCSVITAGPPEFSNVNAVVDAAVANAAIVPVDVDGSFCAFISHPMHLIVDLMGTFSASGDLQFMPTPPHRVHDSRAAG